MLDFRRLSAVDSTRLCELQLSGLPSLALVGWLSSVTELNSYQLFIIHPITSISTPVCDLPTTGGLFVRFSSMETYMLDERLSSAKAFLQSPLQTDFPHFISHSVISDISCSALTQWQDVITSSWRICEGRKVWPWFGLLDVVVVYSFCQYVKNYFNFEQLKLYVLQGCLGSPFISCATYSYSSSSHAIKQMLAGYLKRPRMA